MDMPEPPWDHASGNNSKREGWRAFFAGRSRDDCPFPPDRTDLRRSYQRGWDTAKQSNAKGYSVHIKEPDVYAEAYSIMQKFPLTPAQFDAIQEMIGMAIEHHVKRQIWDADSNVGKAVRIAQPRVQAILRERLTGQKANPDG